MIWESANQGPATCLHFPSVALLKTRPVKVTGAPIAADHLDSIISRVQLVDIAPLRRYEQTDPTKVGEIEQSLRLTEVLINPVIVDPERQLLIDGHHRVQAFESLGLSRIPAFTVDYFSDDLTVKGWNHATAAEPAEMLAAIERPRSSDEGSSSVVIADSRCREHADIPSENPLESARVLKRFIERLRRNGHTVTPRTEADAVRRKLNHGYIRPVVGKQYVIEMVEQGELFPQEINRHLIEDRPLNLRVPMRASLDRTEFKEHLDRVCNTTPLTVKPGCQEGERIYEEHVTLFRTNYLHS